MVGIQEAVDRLLFSRRVGERVVVYGDYDADGITATALLYEVLRRVGIRAAWYIPDRFEEGYGLNSRAIEAISQEGAGLIVTVDCGVRSESEIRYASARDIDVIVTDHHLPGSTLPPAEVVINPRRTDDPYPFKGLSGVGIAYKLSQVLLGRVAEEEPASLLELVAIGTVADLAPLNGENRYLVDTGLKRLNRTESPGLAALIEVAGLSLGALGAASIAFGLAPRLNAAGRMASAALALELLLEQEEARAKELAIRLNALNRARQKVTENMVSQTRADLEDSGETPSLIFASDPSYNEGVVGLAAAKLVEAYYRPAIIARRGAEVTKASARSIPQFPITQALETCSDLLLRFGGHSLAAGFSIRTQDLDELVARLRRLASEAIADEEPKPSVEIDALVGFSALDEGLMDFLENIEPCGVGNPQPVFVSKQVTVLSKRAVGSEGSHLKLTLAEGGRPFDAIAFRMGDRCNTLPRLVDLTYHLERNEYRGIRSLQLNVVDIRPSD